MIACCRPLPLFLLTALPALTADPHLLDRAYQRMYNFDFPGAHALIDQHVNDQPHDPLGYSTRAAALVFQELDRLRILQADFFLDDDRIAEKKKLRPDPKTRDAFYWATRQAQERADSILLKKPNDTSALFANSLAWGLTTDYAAFVEKRQLTSLSYAKTSHSYAKRLITVDKSFGDAYLTTGLSEYILGSLPFFVKWFIKFDDTKGSKQVAIENLKFAARNGRVLGPVARILLAVAALRAKKKPEARDWLHGLVRDYPENPLLKHELERLR
ncbi:MAG: hypothetical protein ACK5UT_02575 [Acidobacteriota bacterium]